MLRVRLLSFFFLAVGPGCAPKSSEPARPGADPVLMTVASLQGLALSAMAVRDSAKKPEVCIPAAIAAAALPPIASGILDAHIDGQLDALPAASWRISSCLDPEAHTGTWAQPDSMVSVAADYVKSAMSIVQAMGASLGPQVPAQACPAYAVATAGLRYLSPLPDLVVQAAAGALDGEVPAVTIDYTACRP